MRQADREQPATAGAERGFAVGTRAREAEHPTIALR
jgi:hypothetical protein